MVVQLANRRKVRVEVQRNTDGEFAENMLFYGIYWAPAQFFKMTYDFYDNMIILKFSEKHIL